MNRSSTRKPAASIATLGLRSWSTRLFDQQLWCWGQDIVRPQGNLLLDLGFHQCRPFGTKSGSTLYYAQLTSCASVYLWGFGILYIHPEWGGLFIKRYDFSPKLTLLSSAVGVHHPEALGSLHRPTTRSEQDRVERLLPELLSWIAQYEHGIAETYGTAYRHRCLQLRNQTAFVDAAEMAPAWEVLAKKYQRFRPEQPIPTNPWESVLYQIRCSLSIQEVPRNQGRITNPKRAIAIPIK